MRRADQVVGDEMTNLFIENSLDNFALDREIEELFQKIADTAILGENLSHNFEVNISLVDNSSIREINKEFRDIDKATDVLSFPFFSREDIEGFKGEFDNLLGDIVISIDKACEQAEDYGHSFEREICFLFTHGMLHLLGYDHMTVEEEREMFSKQKYILDKLHIGR